MLLFLINPTKTLFKAYFKFFCYQNLKASTLSNNFVSSCNVYAKNKKDSLNRFVVKLAILSLESLFSENPNGKYFTQKIIWIIFEVLSCHNFMQKTRKFPCIHCSQNLKHLISHTYWPLLAQKLRHKFFFPKKIFN